MKTLLQVLAGSSDTLSKAGIDASRREAEILLGDFLSMSRTDLYLNFERPLETAEVEEFAKRIARRVEMEPTAYIHGSVSFYDLTLKVNPSVLIPRMETEILVDRIVKDLKTIDLEGKIFLDLCTGSGCIGLAVKSCFPKLHVILSDLSEHSLAVAKENGAAHKLDVEFLQGDLLDPLKGQKVDFIACNPPYVSEAEYCHLSPEVSRFEPKTALIGGETGIEFYVRLEREIPHVLCSPGKVWFEIGNEQGKAVLELFSGGSWKNGACFKDWAGHDRFILVERE
jgi:release factor glutamine methyltransferase